MREDLTIRPVSVRVPEVAAMIGELDRYQASLYPPESNHLDPAEVLERPNCRLLGAYRGERLFGIGAAKQLGPYGELKRFYLAEFARAQGVGECILGALERWLLEQDCPASRLETGIHQRAAIRFYEKLGYRTCAPFGNYRPDPLSVFMEKPLRTEESIIRDHEGAYYLAAFTSRLKGPSPLYSKTAGRMVHLAQEVPGFLGMVATRNEDGEGFTASHWKDRESIARWGRHPEHQEAQKLGKTAFYEKFRLVISRVEV